MDIHLVGLIGALHQRLPAFLPAHEVLGSPTAVWSDEPAFERRRRGDYVWVQGRGDRLHAFLCINGDEGDDVLATFAACDANWRWLVAWRNDLTPDLERRAAELGLGVAVAPRVGALEKVREAAPNPGIFIKAYRDLRAEWRKLSSW